MTNGLNSDDVEVSERQDGIYLEIGGWEEYYVSGYTNERNVTYETKISDETAREIVEDIEKAL